MLASLDILPSASLKNLTETIGWRNTTWLLLLRRLMSAAEKKKIQSVAEHFLAFSVQKIPRHRADVAFPLFRLDGERKVYVGDEEVALELGQVVPSVVHVHLIDGIDSELSLRTNLLTILQKMGP